MPGRQIIREYIELNGKTVQDIIAVSTLGRTNTYRLIRREVNDVHDLHLMSVQNLMAISKALNQTMDQTLEGITQLYINRRK